MSEFDLSGVISTKKKNDCPDCKTRVETYLKSIEEWRAALKAEREKSLKLLEALDAVVFSCENDDGRYVYNLANDALDELKKGEESCLRLQWHITDNAMAEYHRGEES